MSLVPTLSLTVMERLSKLTTEDISHKIGTIQADTQSSVVYIEKISGIIKQISEAQSTIAASVEEQSATTNEIGRGVADSAHGGVEISENIKGVAKAPRDTAEGASRNQLAAQELARMALERQNSTAQYKI